MRTLWAAGHESFWAVGHQGILGCWTLEYFGLLVMIAFWAAEHVRILGCWT